jgi:hypothetical protein
MTQGGGSCVADDTRDGDQIAIANRSFELPEGAFVLFRVEEPGMTKVSAQGVVGHDALENATSGDGSIIHVKRRRDTLERKLRVRFGGHGVEQESRGGFQIFAIHIAELLMAGTVALIGHAVALFGLSLLHALGDVIQLGGLTHNSACLWLFLSGKNDGKQKMCTVVLRGFSGCSDEHECAFEAVQE